jgi:hypothetical protein
LNIPASECPYLNENSLDQADADELSQCFQILKPNTI